LVSNKKASGAAAEAGLDPERARQVLASGQHGALRADIDRWRTLGIESVPSIVIEGRYLIQAGQPPEVFEQALREIAAQPTAA
jgi:predicted DsbA family dithiol-disulfide isomerase